MIITESKIRKIIKEVIEDVSFKESELFLKIKEEKLIYINSGELYIFSDKETKQRFTKLISDLQSFLQKNWKHSDVIIGNGGQLRPMTRSLKGGGDRQKGTKHGVGLAKDLKIFIGLPGEKTTKTVTKGKKEEEVSLIAVNKNLGIKNGMDAARLSREKTEEIVSMMQAAAKKDPDPEKTADDILKDLMKAPRQKYIDILDVNSLNKKVKEEEVEKFVDVFAKYSEKESELAPMLSYGLTRNPQLASNKELVKLIYEFSQLPENKDLIWGGTFGKANPSQGIVSTKGVKEFHHFEYTTAEGIRILSKADNQVNKIIQNLKSENINLGVDVKDMCSNDDTSKFARGLLYKKLLKLKNSYDSKTVAQTNNKDSSDDNI